MKKIYLKDGTWEYVSDDLEKAKIEFGNMLREKLGDEVEETFFEILHDLELQVVCICSSQ